MTLRHGLSTGESGKHLIPLTIPLSRHLFNYETVIVYPPLGELYVMKIIKPNIEAC
jgi:hypothetical protein